MRLVRIVERFADFLDDTVRAITNKRKHRGGQQQSTHPAKPEQHREQEEAEGEEVATPQLISLLRHESRDPRIGCESRKPSRTPSCQGHRCCLSGQINCTTANSASP